MRLGGGLGNQLFQYAFGRRMALANDAALILDGSAYKNVATSDARLGVRSLGLQHFNIQGTLVTEASPEWGDGLPLPDRPWMKRKYIKWSRILERVSKAATGLNRTRRR